MYSAVFSFTPLARGTVNRMFRENTPAKHVAYPAICVHYEAGPPEANHVRVYCNRDPELKQNGFLCVEHQNLLNRRKSVAKGPGLSVEQDILRVDAIAIHKGERSRVKLTSKTCIEYLS